MSDTHGRRPAFATAICFLCAILAWGTVLYSHSVYMDALMRIHGWSASLISSAIFVFWIASLPGTLNAGVMVDRYGPPPVFAIGGLCIGLSLIGLGSVDAPWQLYIVYAVMGFGYPAMSSAAISPTLAPWFEKNFGMALGIALTGASVGGAIIPVIIVQGTAARGFGPTMFGIGIGLLSLVLFVVIALSLLGRHKPADDPVKPRPPFSMRAVLRRPLFWRISAAASLGLAGQVAFLAHQVPFIAATTDRVFAAYMVTVVAIAAAVGRISIGLLSRYIRVTWLAALSYFIHGLGIVFLIFSDTSNLIIAGCVLAGLAVGPIVMLPPILVREAFGNDGFGRTFSMVNAAMYFLAAMAPLVVGVMRDHVGGYETGLWVPVVMEVVAAGLIVGAMRNNGAEVSR